MSLKIGFFGSAAFVVEFLKSIHSSNHAIAFVVTSPDKPYGRGKKILPPEAKEFAYTHSIPCFQPETVKDAGFQRAIQEYNADIFCVIAYGKKLPDLLLNIPRLGSYNVHFSLLPRWRGAAPVNWAIVSGDKETGLTIMKMDAGLDTGDIIEQKAIPISENVTATELFDTLIVEGRSLLLSVLDNIEHGIISPTKQSDTHSTYARVLTKEDGLIDWNSSAMEIHNRVRGLQPWPGGYTFLEGKRVKIWKTRVSASHGDPGTIISTKVNITVGTNKGSLDIIELQEEARNRVMAAEYIRGKGNLTGKKFSSKGAV